MCLPSKRDNFTSKPIKPIDLRQIEIAAENAWIRKHTAEIRLRKDLSSANYNTMYATPDVQSGKNESMPE